MKAREGCNVKNARVFTMRYRLTPMGMAVDREVTGAGKDVEKKPLCTAGRNGKRYSYYGEQYGDS